MTKNTKIVLITLLSLIVCMLMGLLICVTVFNYNGGVIFGTGNYKLVKSEEYVVENINNIDFTTITADIEFYDSKDDKIIIEQYSNSKKDNISEFSASINGSTLKIIEAKHDNRVFIFSFNFTSNNYKIYLPNSYRESLNIESTSGDINIKNNNMTMKDVVIKTISGDINISANITANKVSIETISGDVVSSLLDASIKVKTTSGDIELKDIIGNININSISGDVEINSFDIIGDSNIKTISGDVEVKRINGSVEYKTNTISGDIRVPSSSDSYTSVLEIDTKSGDITVK